MLDLEGYKKLEEAWKFQDFVTKTLLKKGISVNAYQSRDYQMEYGESASGIEIKNDRKMCETNNIYIEFKQMTLRGSKNRDSGINMPDDSWLYVIGDYKTLYVFAKNQLKSLLEKVQSNALAYKQKYGVKICTHLNEEGEITSWGLVLPTKYVEEKNLSILKLETKED